MSDEPRGNIQRWDSYSPSREDAVFALHQALSLLQEAVPLAAKVVGAENGDKQLAFWSAFYEFEKMTDCTLEHFADEVGLARELVWLRIKQPVGFL